MARRFSLGRAAGIQLLIAALAAAAFASASRPAMQQAVALVTGEKVTYRVRLPERQPLRVEPLYDDPNVVSDDELQRVLARLRPKFADARRHPNVVEHALRTWGVEATFNDPEIMSGEEMRDFLLDHGKFLESWGKETPPLLQDQGSGIAIRWGRADGASVHHDHLLACLTEAGVGLDQPVYTPASRNRRFEDVLQEALRDIRLDERETEWSAMAFALWLPPQTTWKTAEGRELSFDLLAERLMRPHLRFGVCLGTHRVYSLMLMLRIDDQFLEQGHSQGILSPAMRERVYAHLLKVRDLISVSQFDDGRWPADWYRGAEAVTKPSTAELSRSVIATGHHLEWLAIAPLELHPPREQIEKAADWVIANILSQSDEDLLRQYTFYSHIGNALALWRKTHPAEFWARITAAQ